MSNFPTSYEEFIYKRTYSRWDWDKKRRENWDETVDRYFDYMLTKVPSTTSRRKFSECKFYVMNRTVMPSMRSLWSAGDSLEKDNIAGFNCSATVIDDPRTFAEIIYILMCGAGVGFSVERQFITKLPEVPVLEDFDYTVVFEDSKLGWAKGYDKFITGLYSGKIFKYDLSKIRPEGAILKTFGGRSSGPLPLKRLLDYTKQVFLDAQGRKLNSLECHDLVCYIASIVVCGGVRRSSLISLSNLSDDRMRHAKDGDFRRLNPQRQLANNSVVYTEKPSMPIFMEEWLHLAQSGSGERGIFNRESCTKILAPTRRDENYDWVTNPCQSGFATVLTPEGIKTFDDIDVDSTIWSGKQWTKVTNKVCTGIKTVYKYSTYKGDFIGTDSHKIMQLGKREKVKDAIYIDFMVGDVEDIIKGEGETGTARIRTRHNLGKYKVYDITVEADEHTYWTGGCIVSNCAEIILRPKSVCNLSEVVVKPSDTLGVLCEKVKVATILGIVQSTFTDFKFLSREWKDNCEEERLLGVSLTGTCDHVILSGEKGEDRLKDWLTAMKETAIKVARKWSKYLDINMPAAITCVKPSGTVSQLVNSSSGLHPRYAPYYIRRVRVSATDPISKFLEDAGVPVFPEVGYTAENSPTSVFEFPIKSPKNSVLRNDKAAIQQLEYWRIYQEYWCEHKPSVTIYVKEDEWLEVGAWVYKNWDIVSGVSFLPYDGGTYPLAPYHEIDGDTYTELKKNFPKLDFSKLVEYETSDYTEGAKEVACVGSSCEI